MMQRVNDFIVTLLIHVVIVELRPAWILQYLSEQVVDRTTFTLYVCTALVPCAANNSQFSVKYIVHSNVHICYVTIIDKR